MPSKADRREDGNAEARYPHLGGITVVWLAFYLLAVTHSLLSSRTAGPVTIAEAQAHPAELR
jgi:hypothetical protein